MGVALLVAPMIIGLSSAGCSSSSDDQSGSRGGTSSAGSTEQREQGRRAARGMFGLADPPSKPTSESARIRMARYDAIAEHILDILEHREPGALASFGAELASGDAARAQKAWPAMREKLREIAADGALVDAVRNDPAFAGVQVQSRSQSVLRPLDLGNDGIPELGRGPNGKFGDGREGALEAARDTVDMAVDPFTPWRTLGKIDRGELVPDPESRLGAYAATRGYPPGSVGEAVHNAIGAIYIALGNYGEERIGRVFNSPEARALYNQPVDSPAGAQMAAIEERYWQNVRAEDAWSPGGQLGSAFSPAVRDFLQRNVFSTGTMPGDGAGGGDGSSGNGGNGGNGGASDADGGTSEQLSKSDCGDKSDGWWCLDAGGGTGWMVYCSGKQIASGCGCAACTTAGVAASCSAPPPPAACPE